MTQIPSHEKCQTDPPKSARRKSRKSPFIVHAAARRGDLAAETTHAVLAVLQWVITLYTVCTLHLPSWPLVWRVSCPSDVRAIPGRSKVLQTCNRRFASLAWDLLLLLAWCMYVLQLVVFMKETRGASFASLLQTGVPGVPASLSLVPLEWSCVGHRLRP